MDSKRIVTLDNDPEARTALAMTALEVASQGNGKSADAARAALAAFKRERADGANETDAASAARGVLRASLKGAK